MKTTTTQKSNPEEKAVTMTPWLARLVARHLDTVNTSRAYSAKETRALYEFRLYLLVRFPVSE